MGRKKDLRAHEEKEATKFEDEFLMKFAPKNSPDEKLYPNIKYGSYLGRNFKVIETKYNYKIEIGNRVKPFPSALAAAYWIKANVTKFPISGFEIMKYRDKQND